VKRFAYLIEVRNDTGHAVFKEAQSTAARAIVTAWQGGVSLFSNYRLSVCIILAGAVAFVLSNLRNMVAGLKPVFFPIYANISSIEGASEGKSLGWCCTWSLHRVVVMLAPLAHLLMVNHKTIVALVAIDKKRGGLSNDWKIYVFKKTICSVGSHVP